MDVREAKREDAEAIEQIRIAGWRTAYRHIYPANELDALPVDGSRWADRLETPPRGWTTFVAERDGRVAGFAAVGPSRDIEGLGELFAIYVSPEVWSTGAGRVLLERSERQLASEYDEAALWVLEDNPRARAFYGRAGWEPDGARKVEPRFGVHAAEVRYRKRLRRSRSPA